MHRALSHLRRHRYVASDVTIAFALRLRDELRQIENPAELPHLLFVVGFVHLWRGRLDEAEAALAESLRVSERVGDAVVELRSRTYLGLVARKRGAVAQTRAAFDRVLQMAAAAGMAEYVAFATAGLGWAAWRDGDAENAERLAREALDGWHAMAVPYPFDWMAAWVVVAAALRRGDVGQAIEHAELMLRTEQQPLPDALLQATSDAVAAWKTGIVDRAAARLRDAAEIAAEDGHL
jgi:ATP/maltotriose-dependent transcriptional regulator MalT